MAFGGRPPATTSLSTSSSDPQELPIDPSLLNVTPGKGYINLSSSSPATITPPQAVRISSGSPLSGSSNIAPTRVESPTFDSPNITPIRVESATIDPPKRHSDTRRVLQQPLVLRRRCCFGLTHYPNSPLYPCRSLLVPPTSDIYPTVSLAYFWAPTCNGCYTSQPIAPSCKWGSYGRPDSAIHRSKVPSNASQTAYAWSRWRRTRRWAWRLRWRCKGREVLGRMQRSGRSEVGGKGDQK